MDDLDPAAAASLDDLAACLKHVHLLADRPTYRALEQQTARENGFLSGTTPRLRRVKLTRTTVSDVLLARKFPRKAFLLTFVEACGVDLENDRRWEQAWDRLSLRYPEDSAPPEKAKKLRQENEELRQQLTAAKHQAETAESRAGQEQARAQMAKSRLDMAIRRATIAESLLEWERKLSGSSFVSVTMPQLGETATEGTIIRWLKREGEHVEADEPLLEIAGGEGHAKIRAPITGTVRATASFRAGETATTATVLAVIDKVAVSSCPVTMPQLGESVTEGTVTRWLKREGERVEVDEPLLEVSTDKVDTEIPSPASGILRSVAADEDETVAVGAQLAVIEVTRPAEHEPSVQPAYLAAPVAPAGYGVPDHSSPGYGPPPGFSGFGGDPSLRADSAGYGPPSGYGDSGYGAPSRPADSAVPEAAAAPAASAGYRVPDSSSPGYGAPPGFSGIGGDRSRRPRAHSAVPEAASAPVASAGYGAPDHSSPGYGSSESNSWLEDDSGFGDPSRRADSAVPESAAAPSPSADSADPEAASAPRRGLPLARQFRKKRPRNTP